MILDGFWGRRKLREEREGPTGGARCARSLDPGNPSQLVWWDTLFFSGSKFRYYLKRPLPYFRFTKSLNIHFWIRNSSIRYTLGISKHVCSGMILSTVIGNVLVDMAEVE